MGKKRGAKAAEARYGGIRTANMLASKSTVIGVVGADGQKRITSTGAARADLPTEAVVMKSGVYDRLVKWIGQPEVEGWEVDLDPHQPTVFDMDIQTAVTLDWPEDVCDRYFENLNT